MHYKNKRPIIRFFGFLAVAFLSVSLLFPTVAMAYGGGGGSRDETDKPENNRVFDDEEPNVPGTPPQPGWHPPMAYPPGLDFDPPERNWTDFWGESWENFLYWADIGGTIACFFVPIGWFKVLHTGGKAVAFAMDDKKQEFARKMLENFEKNHQPTAGGIGTGNTANK